LGKGKSGIKPGEYERELSALAVDKKGGRAFGRVIDLSAAAIIPLIIMVGFISNSINRGRIIVTTVIAFDKQQYVSFVAVSDLLY